MKILEKEKPDLVHFQNDIEIFYASQICEDIIDENKINCGVLIHADTFIPKHSTKANLVDEANSNIIFTTNLLNKIEKSKCTSKEYIHIWKI